MPRINVMQVVHDLNFGGMQRVVSDLCLHMDSSRFRMSVCCIEDLGPNAKELEEREIPVFLVKKRRGFDYLLPLRLMRLFKKQEVDIVHTHGINPFFYGTLGAKLAGFHILQTDDPVRYREQIIRFWDEYLPGTPHGRLEWMKHRNPAGPALWLLALKADSDELIGTISIMPRKVFLNGQMLRTGIVGDLMVHEKHRVFGPAMQLLKAVV